MSEEGWEQKYVQEAFDTNWVVPMGPNVNAFEKDLCKFVTSNAESSVYADSRWPEATPSAWHLNPELKDTTVVCLSAGTAAVHLALIAAGVKAGDEVCVQSFTFCASSHPITYLGAKPVFIGSEKDTWNMDPELLEKAILEPKSTTKETLNGTEYDAWVYPYFTAYVKDNKVVTWKQSKWVLKDAPKKAIEAYNKAYELDPQTQGIKAGQQQGWLLSHLLPLQGKLYDLLIIWSKCRSCALLCWSVQ